MNTDDVVKILEAVGDSWPAAVTAVAVVGGVIAFRVLPRLAEVTKVLKEVRHEFSNNSGSTLKDAVDRIERTGQETKAALTEHIAEDAVWKSQAEELLTSDE